MSKHGCCGEVLVNRHVQKEKKLSPVCGGAGTDQQQLCWIWKGQKLTEEVSLYQSMMLSVCAA